ncbi:hypothetical protein [Haloferula sargassicola]|uniref:TPM domain-containing protein n=1 Tax=Haloferula sargassicola TaxID=490096 RepID=A0ABP9UIG9_9BACT
MKWLWLCGLLAALPVSGQEQIESAEGGSKPVPGGVLEQYFADPPSGFLMDPQNLLPADERKEREKFLRYHSEDSQIDFYLLLFEGDQQLPEGVRIEELGERFSSAEKPALIALYFLGEPKRALVEFSPDLKGKVSPADANRILVQSVRAAEEKGNSYDQLEAFCVQMAIRIYWVEQSVGLAAAPPSEQPPPAKPKDVPPPEQVPDWRSALQKMSGEVGVPAVVLVLAVFAGLIARWLIRRREVHTFPVIPCESRLGGGHGAGIGSVVTFGSASVSPTTQREQTRDPLGGI